MPTLRFVVVFTLIHRVKQWQQIERDWSHSSHKVDNEGEGSIFKYVHNSKKKHGTVTR